jgi:hypothetical protein
MAGKRQHYVPRLLQRGFLHDPSQQAERTWLHRRPIEPRLVSIRDVGVEEWFYSKESSGGELTLDDIITNIESDLSGTINDLRATPIGSAVNSDIAAHFVVHLVMRTNHLRTLMSKGFSSVSEKIQSIFSDPSSLERMFGFNSYEIAPRVTESIRGKAFELASSGIPIPFTERIMSFLVRENGDDIVRNITKSFAPLLPHIFGDLTSKIRDAHNEILQTSSGDNAWVTALSSLSWTVEAGEDLILPDCVALATEANERLVPLLFSRAADVRRLALPISRERILIGVAANEDRLDLTTLNHRAAACSEAFFIGARPYDNDVVALIGSGPMTAVRQAIELAMDSASMEGVSTPEISARSHSNDFELLDFKYTIRLADFGDEALAKQLGEVFQVIVAELSRRRLPLQNLDGFTIAKDYGAALACLDRGAPELPPAKSDALEYGAGIARTVSLQRDGTRKQQIVLNADVAQACLSDDDETRASGLYIVAKMLVIVAHSTLFADQRCEMPPDLLAAQLHSAVAMTPCGWFSARERAFLAPDMGQRYAELVITSI